MSNSTDKVLPRWLVLVLSPDASTVAVASLARQAKALGLEVLLTGSCVQQVFADATLADALQQGLFDRLLLSSSEQHLGTDALDALKCLPNAHVWLAYMHATSDMQLAALSRCWQIPAVAGSQHSAVGRVHADMLYGETAAFRQLNVNMATGADALLSHIMANGEHSGVPGQSAPLTAGNAQSLFVTAVGVERFGGLSRFLSLPFYQGELLQGQFARCWQLCDIDAPDFDKALLPLSLRCADNHILLLDLQPAQQSDCPSWHRLSVPRMVLSIRKLPAASYQPASLQGKAVFAMSLFNKAGYVQQALYSVAMQSHTDVALHIIDDGSCDGSLLRIAQFQALAASSLPILLETDGQGRGTYHIRNRIITAWQHQAACYLVQDADDISCSQRATFQLMQLQLAPQTTLCIADMVRIDAKGRLLSLEGLSERYGSATLCAPLNLHQQVGYYENICKNADSEFVDRVKAVYGRATAAWYRYPVLYQRYDGNNLTADIYQQQNNLLQANHAVRARHKALYQQRHKDLTPAKLVRCYQMDSLPDHDYQLLLPGFVSVPFMQPGQLSARALALLFDGAQAQAMAVVPKADCLRVQSQLDNGVFRYIYAPNMLNAAGLRAAIAKGEQALPLYIDATFSDSVLLVALYLDEEGKRLSHQFFAPATNLTMQLPDSCTQVQLGWRLTATTTLDVRQIRFSHQQLDAVLPCPGSRYLLLTNHYPSDDALYRNAFVHSRVKGYLAQGVQVDVFRSRPKAPLSVHSFDGVTVYTGCPSLLSPALAAGRYTQVLVHFLDNAMWQVLHKVIAVVPVTVWLHGAEIHTAKRRRFNYNDDASYAVAVNQSEQRLQFWRQLLSPCPENLRLVFVSHSFADEVLSDLALAQPLSAAQYQIIHNPIDTDLFRYQPKLLTDRFNILVLRPFSSAQYANDLAVAALLQLAEQPEFAQVNVTVMGDGALFETLTKPLQTFSNVHLVRGFLTQTEIAALHKTHGIFLCPTRWDSQGVSRDEAMASGLVAITNRIAAVGEFCDEQSALLCEPESATALAEALLSLIRDPVRFMALSAGGAARVASRDATSVIQQELALFHRMANN